MHLQEKFDNELNNSIILIQRDSDKAKLPEKRKYNKIPIDKKLSIMTAKEGNVYQSNVNTLREDLLKIMTNEKKQFVKSSECKIEAQNFAVYP